MAPYSELSFFENYKFAHIAAFYEKKRIKDIENNCLKLIKQNSKFR